MNLGAHDAPDQLREMRGQRRVRALGDDLVDPVKDDRAQRDAQRTTLRQGHGVCDRKSGILAPAQRSKVALYAHFGISHANLHMCFRLNLRSRIQFAALGEDPSYGIERGQLRPVAKKMDKVHHRAVQMPFHQIGIFIMRWRVGGQFGAPDSVIACELSVSILNDRQRSGIAQIQAVSQIDDRADNERLLIFRDGAGGCFCRNSAQASARSGLFSQKVRAGTEPIVNILAEDHVLAAARENSFRRPVRVTTVIAEEERSREHPTALAIVCAHLVVFGDESVFEQKRARGFRRLVNFVAGLLDRSDFASDLGGAAFGDYGDHEFQLSRLRAAHAS